MRFQAQLIFCKDTSCNVNGKTKTPFFAFLRPRKHVRQTLETALKHIRMPQAGRRLHATRKTAAGKAFCKRRQNALQKAIFYKAKGRLSQCKRRPFGMQKTAFRKMDSLQPDYSQAAAASLLCMNTLRTRFRATYDATSIMNTAVLHVTFRSRQFSTM